MTSEQAKKDILDCADERGIVRFGCSPPPEVSELVREGRLLRISYFVFLRPLLPRAIGSFHLACNAVMQYLARQAAEIERLEREIVVRVGDAERSSRILAEARRQALESHLTYRDALDLAIGGLRGGQPTKGEE